MLAIVGGLVSLEYLRVARETARAVRIRLTRARRRFAWGRLRVERRRLYDAIMAEVDGESPG